MNYVHIVLRLILLVLFLSDLLLKRKLKKQDNTLYRELNGSQKAQQILYYASIAAGLLVPFDAIYLIVVIFSIGYFFYFTDREIYLNHRQVNIRSKTYDINKIKNLTYEKKVLEFDYKNEHVKLTHPLLTDNILEKEIIHKAQKNDRK